MRIVDVASVETYKYKDIKRSLDLYHWCNEEGILIGTDTYNKPYAVFCYDDNRVIRNITFDNKQYDWRVCFLTEKGVKFLRKHGLLKSCYM